MIPEFVRYIAAAVVVIGLLIWYIPRKNEWGQVIELSEYTSILCARQTLKELVTTDVETYSRFQNVRYDNLHKYLNCAQVDHLIREHKKAREDITTAANMLSQISDYAKYTYTKKRLNKLLTSCRNVRDSSMTVIVYYRTPKRADLRQKSFSVREEDWESILRKTQNKSNKTFAQEQRALVTPKIRFEVLKRDNFTCQYCGAHGEGVVLEVDHIIPISKGGTSDMGNLITTCFDCNRGKSSDLVTDKQAM